jgi:HD-GYP domain-containing protein (c-di-GMP phosphodiesterase class II)
MGIKDDGLQKQSSLNPGEYQTIQEHPLIGVKIVGRNEDSDINLSKRGGK